MKIQEVLKEENIGKHYLFSCEFWVLKEDKSKKLYLQHLYELSDFDENMARITDWYCLKDILSHDFKEIIDWEPIERFSYVEYINIDDGSKKGGFLLKEVNEECEDIILWDNYEEKIKNLADEWGVCVFVNECVDPEILKEELEKAIPKLMEYNKMNL